jgi:hypothetical protein
MKGFSLSKKMLDTHLSIDFILAKLNLDNNSGLTKPERAYVKYMQQPIAFNTR